MGRQRGTKSLKSFKIGDRFWIDHRAYKSNEIFEVLSVDKEKIRIADVRTLKNDVGVQIGWFDQKTLDAYEGCIIRVEENNGKYRKKNR